MKSSVLCLILFAACTGGGAATGATCPTTDPPTYENFGDQFFTTYCRACHSSEADNRHGAPGSQNYDTEVQIRQHAAAIDATSAAGPHAINTDMPDMSGPVTIEPTDAEREQLGQFLACIK